MLKVDQIAFAFPHRILFQGLSFELKPKCAIHLVGPNGVGKSTLMSVIAGLLPPSQGKLSFQDAKGHDHQDRRSFIEYLPAEANGLFMKLSAFQNLSFWVKLRRKLTDAKEIEDALNFWGLDNPVVRNKLAVEKFSTGMRRRLALARLSLSQSACWLLDEPIYGLDQKGIDLFRQALGGHIQKGGGAVIISHDYLALSGLVTETIDLAEYLG